MRHLISAALLAAMAPVALSAPAPALAQSPSDQARWDAAQARYQQETERFQAERDRYARARSAWRRGDSGYGYAPPPPPPGDRYGNGYAPPPPPPPPPSGRYGNGYAGDDRYEADYDPSRYYRDGPGYQERVLAADDRVYRGTDGRYYCKRNDGTTGLIIGAAGGGILGNVIDGGHSRAAGTLIGAALGALAGKAVDQSNNQIRCR